MQGSSEFRGSPIEFAVFSLTRWQGLGPSLAIWSVRSVAAATFMAGVVSNPCRPGFLERHIRSPAGRGSIQTLPSRVSGASQLPNVVSPSSSWPRLCCYSVSLTVWETYMRRGPCTTNLPAALQVRLLLGHGHVARFTRPLSVESGPAAGFLRQSPGVGCFF